MRNWISNMLISIRRPSQCEDGQLEKVSIKRKRLIIFVTSSIVIRDDLVQYMHMLKWVKNTRSSSCLQMIHERPLWRLKAHFYELLINVGIIPLGMLNKGRFSKHVNTWLLHHWIAPRATNVRLKNKTKVFEITYHSSFFQQTIAKTFKFNSHASHTYQL